MDSKRKIVYLVSSLQRGGAEIVTLRVAKFLREKKGIDPIFLSMSEGCDEGLLEGFGFDPKGIAIYKVPDGEKRSKRGQVAEMAEMAFQKERPLALVDTVYPSSIALYEIARRYNIKLVWWLHLLPFFISQRKMSKWELKAQKSFVRKILYYTVSPLRAKFSRRSLADHYAYVLSHVDLFFVLCEGYKRELVKKLKPSKLDADKILPMINTIERIADVKLDGREKKIVSIGRIDLYHKRYDRLVEIWKYTHERLPDWSFDIYGWSPDEVDICQLESWIQESGAPRIRFCGISRNPSEVYATASVSILTSAYEGWPVALMEAQRQGVVPVATNCCKGVEEVICGVDGDKEAGVLMPEPFNALRFADRLVELCLDDERRRQLQQNCLDKISDYQPEVNDASWQAFFDLLGIE